MAWWSRTGGLAPEAKKSVPKGIWTKCEKCATTIYEDDLIANLRVCGACGHHFRMSTEDRIRMILDEGTWTEHDAHLESGDPLGFRVDGKKYTDQIRITTRKTGGGDAYRAGTGLIGGIEVEVGFFVFEFMGGSMGSVVGEKITRQFERALACRRPAVLLSASGGARMQEGVLSLMQMAKTSAARSRLREASVPYVSVLLHPTTGGVAASIAMLGDVIIAEPDALIGFAGPRVIEQTIRQQLPPGFQRSEFLLEHGMVDMVVPRDRLKPSLVRVLRWFSTTSDGVAAERVDGEAGDRDGAGPDGPEASGGLDGSGGSYDSLDSSGSLDSLDGSADGARDGSDGASLDRPAAPGSRDDLP